MKKQKNSSLIRQISGHIQWPKFFRTVWTDVGLAIVMICTWCIAAEVQCGAFRLFQRRQFDLAQAEGLIRSLRRCTYSFRPADSDALFTVNIGQILSFLAFAVPILLALQLLRWGIEWSKNEQFLREVLRPINEAAMEAQRIAESSINEQQIHDMERAIDNITDSEDSVHIGDEDLRGVETSINKLLRRLKDSYEEQTRFVDDASHELRTPIAVIHGYSSILDRWGKDDPATLEESIKAILEETEHMQTLVDQLLFLARGDGGRQQLNMQPTDPAALLREVIEESRMIDDAHEYVFRDKPSATVLADPAMLKQAVRILTDNASKYTPQGGSITLWTESLANGQVGLNVQDQGVGLTQEEASRMFERFFRGDAVRGSTRGSGLGLSIAQWIIEHHSGHIEVLGYPDIGTRVTICLPAAKSESLPAFSLPKRENL